MEYEEFKEQLDELGWYGGYAKDIYDEYSCFWDMDIETFKKEYNLAIINDLANNLDVDEDEE